ncbi:type I restriction endonuclease subunit R [Candidatus Saccharibacteria bacterium]|nr:type I restriction endonuclease subunit R [Candidatus Saccharibacteria bacterium]
MNFNEEALEKMIIETLQSQGYDYQPGEEIERDYHDVLLLSHLENSLSRLNPNLQESTISEAIRKIKNLDQNNLIRNNQEFSRMLHEGVKVPEYTNHGVDYKTVRLIDYDNIDNNEFLVVNQYTIIEHSEKRPDIIIFINGMPLVVIELKSATRDEEDTTPEAAYNQLNNYKKIHIPSLFYYNQILIASDGVTARAGTITCKWERFSDWKKTGINDTPENLNTLEPMIHGLLKRETLLDLIGNFILYQEDTKILPAYHQYYGVKKAVERTLTTGDGRIGVFWHTQGSGKSFSMVFYAANMIKRLNNPTIVVVTDRNDLDDQLYETFAKCSEYLRQKPEHVESRKDLIERLENKQVGGIIFTTLQKFEEETGLLSERDDIIVIADEAHRSHYGIDATTKLDMEKMIAVEKYGTAKYLHDALPNAKYVGFTGTPIENKDHSTSNVFGDIIDVYDMTQAIDDGATVPITYEARMAKVGLNDKILQEIDAYYDTIENEGLADEEKIARSKQMMTHISQVIEDPDRLEMIVKDILNHYESRKDLVANKAMIVAYSRNSGFTMYKKILELRPELKGKVYMVMTPSNKDSEEMALAIGSKSDKHERERLFKDPNSEFKIVIVVDMWLTGFDVPCLGTMYVDKPMKAHNLMQAIARTNRVYKDKTGGLIVDYIGLKKWLLEALSTYTKRDQGKIVDSEQVVKVLRDKIELIRNLLHGLDYSNYNSLDNIGKYQLLNKAANFILQDEDTKNKFMHHARDVKNLYSISTGSITFDDRWESMFIISVRSFINKLTLVNGKLDVSDINRDVAEMLQQAIQDDELIQVGKILHGHELNLLSNQILQRLAAMENKNIAAEILKKALKQYIEEVARANYVMSQKFSERFKKIVDIYNNRTLVTDIEKIIQQMIELKQDIDKELIRKSNYDLSPEEVAFFDALGDDPEVKELMKDETLVQIAKELVEVVNSNMTVDWDIKRSSQAHMRMQIKRLLIKYNYPPNKSEKAVSTVIKQAELKCNNIANE